MAGFSSRSVKRIEDYELVTGRGRFVDDIRLRDTVYASFVRSSYPHALIRGVDVSDVAKDPRALLVLTFRDIEGLVEPYSFGDANSDPMYVLARSKVRYVGEPIAMVVSSDPYTAHDLAERVVVDYEPLEGVSDPFKAVESDVRIHESAPRNIAFERDFEAGDVDGVFRSSPSFRVRLINQDLAPAPMETRGVLASFDGANLTVWVSTQTPYDLKEEILSKLKVDVRHVRVIQPHVGGAFGAKIFNYPEELLVALASYMLKRPVLWRATRTEDMITTNRGRALIADLEVAYSRDGEIRGLRGEIMADLGAYPWGTLLPVIAVRMLPGPYRIQNARIKAVGIYTNKVPLAAYRGAGRPEATFFIERIMDMVADELNMDPVEIRLRNMVRADEMPYRNIFGLTYDSGDYRSTLEKGLEKLGYRELSRWADEEARRGNVIGVGFAFYIEITSGGPYESAIVRVGADGKVTIISGSTPTGQGDATVFAQLASEILGVPMENIEVLWGDTDLIGRGFGTFGSRTLAVGGGAVIKAAERVREKAVRVAATVLETDPEDIEIVDGVFRSRRDPSKTLTWKQVAEAAYSSFKGDLEPGLEAVAYYDPIKPVYPFGVHLAVVKLDPETGRVKILKYRSYDDVGKAINPMLAEGQIVGGIVQGIGQALLEHFIYDESSNPLNPNLAEYLIPTAVEVPDIEVNFQETPTHHPHRVRGVGEIGTIAAPPAVVSAVENALRRLGVRARLTQMPLTPSYIWSIINSK